MKQENKQQGKNKSWIFGLSGIVGLILILAVLASIQEKQTSNINTSGVPVGTEAPEFNLQSTEGNISLADYKGGNVVLYFYEGNG
ncbi:redoxin domain-containing protein [Virgibacillus sp. DJP39]|uniref:redoxin domain-containing protein n=1 Tax=Virgibacillus sp. DJP39 TaxID=3409790 RepID=UPI003BB57DE9